MLKNIRGLLGFSKGEMNGILILVPLILFFVFFPAIYRSNHEVAYDPSADQRLLDSLLTQLRALEASVTATVDYFEFDPNLLPLDSFQLLGVPRFLASRIGNYREAGGEFRQAQDLRKIYDFPDTLFEKLQPWIRIAKKECSSNGQYEPDQQQAQSKPKMLMANLEIDEAEDEPFKSTIVDINSADTTALKTLNGIGSVYSTRIVKYRTLLGGYHDISQIKEVYGISDSLFQRLLPHLVLNPKVQPQKIAINFASFKALNAHPYISFEQTKEILNEKSRLGKYKGAADLIKLKLFDSAQVFRILPYIDFR